MDRISTNLPNDSMQFFLRERQRAMTDVQGQIASQTRLLNLRDDPMAASHATRYRSFEARLDRFSTNIQTVQERHRIAEGYVQQAVDLMQRAREIAVQGANGTYTPDDLEIMAVEVNEILTQMIEVGNARGSDGTAIFAGDRTQQLPFRALQGIVASGERSQVTEVQYVGTIGRREAEIGENSYIDANIPGNDLFWAENQTVQARVDARDYQVDTAGSFMIDGVSIAVRPGDTAHSLIERINDSGAAVRAELDPVFSSLVIRTTSPHQVWMEDGPGSTVLQDLGLVTGDGSDPPHNYAPETRVSGGSLFDSLVALRDQLAAGDQEAIGSRGIRGVDLALDNLFSSLGRIGAIDNRLSAAFERTEMEILEVAQQNSRVSDIDLAEAVTELRTLETTHRAALAVSARIMQPTLLDFIR